jgi:hypothetical protein
MLYVHNIVSRNLVRALKRWNLSQLLKSRVSQTPLCITHWTTTSLSYNYVVTLTNLEKVGTLTYQLHLFGIRDSSISVVTRLPSGWEGIDIR